MRSEFPNLTQLNLCIIFAIKIIARSEIGDAIFWEKQSGKNFKLFHLYLLKQESNTIRLRGCR